MTRVKHVQMGRLNASWTLTQSHQDICFPLIHSTSIRLHADAQATLFSNHNILFLMLCLAQNVFFFLLLFTDARTLHGLSKDVDLEPLIIQEDSDLRHSQEIVHQPRNVSDLPVFETTNEHHDNLNDVSSLWIRAVVRHSSHVSCFALIFQRL